MYSLAICISCFEEISIQDFPGGAVDKIPPANAVDTVWPLIQKDSTCLRATKPACCSYWACAPRAYALRQEKPQNEKPAHRN